MAKHPCVLYDRECIGCGECDRCDLDPEKICDNCMKCINGEAEYRSIAIDGIVMGELAVPKHESVFPDKHLPQ